MCIWIQKARHPWHGTTGGICSVELRDRSLCIGNVLLPGTWIWFDALLSESLEHVIGENMDILSMCERKPICL